MLAPPLNITEHWFAPHVAYSLSKYGMSLCVLGLAGELRGRGIAVNALWPRTVIGTAALQVALNGQPTAERRRVRRPEIVADAAHAILIKPSREFTGRFCIDEDVLRAEGEADFTKYREPGVREDELLPDFFL
jgi:citronellol/citronellal dehydrogenase